MSSKLRELLASGRPILCDGGMGSQLVERGLRVGECPEQWNVDRPDAVQAIHQAYASAGCQLLTTNTFGGSPIALSRHGLEPRTDEFNRAGAQVARAAAGDRACVLGDLGPLTAMLEPYGDCSEADASLAYARQVEALRGGGVDGFIVETLSDATELSLAVAEAAKTGLPVLASFTFARTAGGEYRTMMGTTIPDALAAARDAGASAIGTNCGTSLSLEDYLQIARQLVAAAGGLPVLLQPNAGSPRTVGDRVVYDATPANLAALVPLLLESGVRIIGGCCGTTPAHLAAMRAAMDARLA